MVNNLEKRFRFPPLGGGTPEEQAAAWEGRRNIVMLWGDTSAIEGHKHQPCPMASTRLKRKFVHRGVHVVSVNEYLTTKICNWSVLLCFSLSFADSDLKPYLLWDRCVRDALQRGHPVSHVRGQDYYFEMKPLPTRKKQMAANKQGGWRETRKPRERGANADSDKFSGEVWRLRKCQVRETSLASLRARPCRLTHKLALRLDLLTCTTGVWEGQA